MLFDGLMGNVEQLNEPQRDLRCKVKCLPCCISLPGWVIGMNEGDGRSGKEGWQRTNWKSQPHWRCSIRKAVYSLLGNFPEH